MVESKRNRVQLVVSPSSTLQKCSSKSDQECRDVERINVLDLKALIVKRIGVQRAKRYFVHFVRFLSSRLSKVELDKLVIATIGKKNVVLHNQLVRAILSNAVKGKVPPPLPPSSSEQFEKFSSKYQSPSVTSYHPHTSPSTVSNGDSFLSSPRSLKSTARQYRDRDYRVSPLGHSEAHSAPNVSHSVQQSEVAAKQLDAESNSSLEPPAKRARVDCPASDDSPSVIESEVLGGDVSCFDKQETKEGPLLGTFVKGSVGFSSYFTSGNRSRRPSFCALPAHFLRRQDGLENYFSGSDDLPDSDLMHGLVEQTAIREGLEGASRESAEVLNLALDAYIKKLIQSCVREHTGRGHLNKFQGFFPRDNRGAMKLEQERSPQPPVSLVKEEHSISLTSFKVAMDMNPQQLGSECAVQLEKMLFRVFDQ
ncbi:hypothetical protein GOP47_0016132 [Adiantum capillus-veneris]|uniref:Uncharacterized protein n=1 Tax=Adiantum capillus-veneris TaxID=13818 RepID=A0A9D4UL32_ADICA|nr:hypothetical protein GOP47_0016132 [Adiantum capillus-veneris]